MTIMLIKITKHKHILTKILNSEQPFLLFMVFNLEKIETILDKTPFKLYTYIFPPTS